MTIPSRDYNENEIYPFAAQGQFTFAIFTIMCSVKIGVFR
jgi:hypothetical protein